ncbi:TIGR03086 family metal-binding protein [Yinghuangia seranimata]|uniref:TIGR03086 family metal-binding protein n=1 Tax=Yinghuangia seranimata TaxID=408067 RepID=UPI00248B1CA2|nr:TIGR03086 family metal-binding protein [Yinghuangia seranimata]MDI2129789.1 TIGR03086 family metal-binding protein [Yinghuangia seranimata]
MERSQDDVVVLDRAVRQLADLVREIRPEQGGLPTPCALWDVRQLVGHVVEETTRFAAVTEGRDGSAAAGVGDAVGEDWAAAFDAAAARLTEVWHRPGALDRPHKLPFGAVPGRWAVMQQTTELALRAWDIARAIDSPTRLDEEVGALTLRWSRENVVPSMRGEAGGGYIGLEVEVADDAPVYDALAAFSGRDPRR